MKVCSVCQHCYEDAFQSCEAGHGSLFLIRSGSRGMCRNYRLDVLLEHGAASETYRAAHVVSNQSFVVKIINVNSEGETAEAMRRELQIEAQSAARVSHPNLTGVYESGLLNGGDFYTVGELIEGQTLRDYLTNSGGSLPEPQAVAIARQTAEALGAAHTTGIVHRAVNPANIVISFDEANQSSVKLRNVDFGAVEQTNHVASVSATQTPFEAFRYLSPEQCSTQPADARTDVYSLGVVLYEMLCGGYPYNAPTRAAIVSEPINEKPFERLRYDTRALLAYVLKQSLQKTPAARLPSAVNFARQLRQIEQLVAPPIGMHAPPPPRSLPIAKAAVAATAAEVTFSPEMDGPQVENFQSLEATVPESRVDLTAAITPTADFVEPSVEEIEKDAFVNSDIFSESEPILVKKKSLDTESFTAEPIRVKRKAAVEAAFESHPISVRKRQSAATPFEAEPIRLKRRETVIAATEPKTDSRVIINLEDTDKRAAPAPNFGYLSEEIHHSQQHTSSKRPLFIGAGLLALLASIGVGMFLYNQRQNLAEPTIAAATPIPAASPLTKPNSTAVEEAAPETQLDSGDIEDAAPVVNEKSSATAAKRENQTQPREVSPTGKSVAESNAPIKNQPAFERTTDNQLQADRQSRGTVKGGSEQNELSASLDEWIAATNNRDIEGQMNYYAPKVDAYYRTRNVSPDAVRAEKRRIFERARKVDIQTGAPSIAVSPDGRTATMRFRKKYAIKEGEQNRTGEVIQELRWVKSGKGWKIVSERDVKVINR